jgi:seryl-tRNA synthetase
MLDIRWMRENREALAEAMRKLNVEDAPWAQALEFDQQRRQILTQVEGLRAELNSGSRDIGKLFREKRTEEANTLKARMTAIGSEIEQLDANLRAVESAFQDAMLRIPNIPEPDVPVALDESGNQVVKQWGDQPTFDFTPLPHWEIGPRTLGIIDFERGVKLVRQRFYVLKGAGARLQRALIDWFTDVHVNEHGYEEIYPPFMVRSDCMVGTGNLPKFGENLYRDAEEDLWFIPTAEVPVTNIYRDEIIEPGQLPIYYVANTPCFRREKVSAGKDVRGIKRVHQFQKVEMVKFVEPARVATSWNPDAQRRGTVRAVGAALSSPRHRHGRPLLCRRHQVRHRGVGGWLWGMAGVQLLLFFPRLSGAAREHPLSQSGRREARVCPHAERFRLALPRIIIAILEKLPAGRRFCDRAEVLRPYMGGLEVIR